MTITAYPDWYLIFCAIVTVILMVTVGIVSWNSRKRR